jgi:hypothetical protein
VIYIKEHAPSKKFSLGFFCMLDWCPSSQGVFLKHGQLPMTCKMSTFHKSKFNLCLDICSACPVYWKCPTISCWDHLGWFIPHLWCDVWSSDGTWQQHGWAKHSGKSTLGCTL